MKQSTRTLWLQIVTGTLIVVFLWHSRQRGPVSLDSGFSEVMGTYTRIVAVAADKKTAAAAVEAGLSAIRRIDALMSDWDPTSQLSEVNRRAFAEPVVVDAKILEVLTAAIEFSRFSDGAFDVTIGPVVLLWRDAKQTGIAPSPDQIAAAHAKVGWQNLLLDPETQSVRFALEGMSLDLGGIAKGSAVDRAVAAMKQAGAQGGMVSIGGEIYCFGTPAGQQPDWYIGLQDPRHNDAILLRLNLSEMAVSTSGDYRRFVIIDGQKHSHIVNPATAESAGTFSSATVIAPTSMQADALATAVSVLGPEKGLALLASVPNTEALLIPSDQPDTFLKTPGFDAYIHDIVP